MKGEWAWQVYLPSTYTTLTHVTHTHGYISEDLLSHTLVYIILLTLLSGFNLYAILHTLIHTLCLSKYATLPITYTCGFVLTCMQTEEIEMHASTKIIVVTGFTTELHAGRQRVHFSILQPFLLTTYGNNRRLEDIVSDK